MRRLSGGTLLLALAIVLGSAPPAAEAALPQESGNVDLLTQANVQIDGATANGLSGWAVAAAGDVNDDQIGDVIIGATGANATGSSSGSAYVVFGSSSLSEVDLASLGTDGFRIDGSQVLTLTGSGVSGAGDMNSDGLDDVIVGVQQADSNGLVDSGAAFVVFGKKTTETVSLASLGTQGFRIDGAAAGQMAGRNVSEAGDVNGDGRPDVIVGLWALSGGNDFGPSYVVFGKPDTNPVNLAALGTGGFRIDSTNANDSLGRDVAGAGDVNGDGLSDLIVGADADNENGRSYSGSAYVVFGKSDASTVDLNSLNGGGFRIDGANQFNRAGTSVSEAGDMNDDGLSDLIVGADAANAAYVVFGKSDAGSVDLASLGAQGFRINGPGSTFTGASVSKAGDVNGDGRPDVIVGAFNTHFNGRGQSGSAYVVFGKPDTSAVNLVSLGSAGFRVDGAAVGDRLGDSVSDAGDVNGDGHPDVIAGAIGADNHSRPSSGSSYVVYGFGPDPPVPPVPVPGNPTVESPAKPAPCARMTSSPSLSSVSAWTRLRRGGLGRVRGPVGGLVLRSTSSARFKLLVKQLSTRRARVKRVAFSLDGRRVAIDKRAPFNLSVKPTQLAAGGHTLKAVVTQAKAKRALKYKVFAADCHPTRFSAAMSTKKRGAGTNLKLTAQTYGPELDSAHFTLPAGLRTRTASRAGKTAIGTLALVSANGQRSTVRLKLPKRAGKRAVLSSGAAHVEISIGPRVEFFVDGLPRNVTGLSLKFNSKKSRLLKNSRRCRALSYRASLRDRMNTALALRSEARICH